MLQTAIIAKRVTDGDPDTDEIRRLTEAAGARVVDELTQTRPPDPGTELGAGKVAALAERVEAAGADTVVVDAALSPRQTVTLEERVGAAVVDRHRVVLEIFARQARTRRAQLQVDLARLRYRLPRVRERADEGALNRFTESGTPYYDLLDRIDELERKLGDLPAVDEQFREERREQGFDLVAIAGYTNAGKSTLLRRLADEMALEASTHGDLESSAAVEDRLFETLETTTRRATLDGRDALVTDTVGFLDDLPHWLVESFRGTLTEVEAADVVLLVADVAQPTGELRRKLTAVHETLGEDHPPVVTALNKADQVDGAETLEERLEAVSALTPDPVVVSARHDETLEPLERRIRTELPTLVEETLTLPLSDDVMSVLSRIHDDAVDVAVTYEGARAVVSLRAKPSKVEQFRARAEALQPPG